MRERVPERLARHGSRVLRLGAWLTAAIPSFVIAHDVPGWSSHYGRYAGPCEQNLRRVFARRAVAAASGATLGDFDRLGDGGVVCARGRVAVPSATWPCRQLFAPAPEVLDDTAELEALWSVPGADGLLPPAIEVGCAGVRDAESMSARKRALPEGRALAQLPLR